MAAHESEKQITARGLLFEHGDLYEMTHEIPNDRYLGNLDTAEKNRRNRICPVRSGPPGASA